MNNPFSITKIANCYECGKPVMQGDAYLSQDIRSENSWINIKAHLACADASVNIWPGQKRGK